MSAHKGIWFFRNKTCWIVAALNLAAIDSDIECCPSKWTIVGAEGIAVIVREDASVTCGLSTQLTRSHGLKLEAWRLESNWLRGSLAQRRLHL